MKLDQLRQVLELSRTGSFSQAARNLFLSQPNLSHSIKQLEDELGEALFTRARGGVLLTPFGVNFIAHAELVCKDYAALEDFCRRPEVNQRVSLRVATLNLNSVSYQFIRIVKKYLQAPINFSLMNFLSLDRIIEAISASHADIAFLGILAPYAKATKARFANAKIDYYKMSEDKRMYALVGPTHPFFRAKESVAMADLAPFTLATYRQGSADPSFALGAATGLAAQAANNVYVNSHNVLLRIVRETPAVGLIANKSKTFAEEMPELDAIPIEDCPLRAEYGWIKLRRLPITDIMAELIAMVESGID